LPGFRIATPEIWTDFAPAALGITGIDLLSYWRMPDEVLEDPESIDLWAGKAYGVALKARVVKRRI